MNGPIPADVPRDKHELFCANYAAITKKSNRLFLFTCDHTIEHLHDDLSARTNTDPRLFFEIAAHGTIGALATHPGLIARHAADFSTIQYIAKLNGKTNLLDAQQYDPESAQLYTVQDVVQLNEQNNNAIRGIGITIYIGSEYENEMLTFAAQSILHAHQHGLVAIVWAYLRGAAIKNEHDPHLLAGAAGLAHSLGADFVKLKMPHAKDPYSALQTITQAAGNTKVICSGGALQKKEDFLHNLHKQIHLGGTSGCAVGRNVFQHPRAQAIAMTQAISAIVYDDATADEALTLYASLLKIGF